MKKLIFFLSLLVLVSLFVYYYFTYSPGVGQKKIKKEIARQQKIAPPPSLSQLYKDSEKLIDRWYESSDSNLYEEMLDMLHSNWKTKENQHELKRLLSSWSYTPQEIEQGYRSKTLKKTIIFRTGIDSVYGKVCLIRVADEAEIGEPKGWKKLYGITTFITTYEFEPKKKRWKPKILTLDWVTVKVEEY